MTRLFAGGTPEAVLGAVTSVTTVDGVDARYPVVLPGGSCRVWQTETGQNDRLTDLLDATGVPLIGGLVTADDFGQLPAFQLPEGLLVDGVWLDPVDTSAQRFFLPCRLGPATAAQLYPRLTPDGTGLLNGSNEPMDLGLSASFQAVLSRDVVHGANAQTPRPAWPGPVDWYGTVTPANMQTGDRYFQVTATVIPPSADWIASYDASTITGLADGATMTAWADSGTHAHPLAAVGTGPTFKAGAAGAPAFARFAAQQSMVCSPGTNGQPAIVLAVVRPTTVTTTAGQSRRFFGAQTTAAGWAVQQTGTGGGSPAAGWSARTGSTASAVVASPVAAAGVWSLVVCRIQGGSSKLEINGVETAIVLGTDSTAVFSLGGTGDNTAAVSFLGDIGDVRIGAIGTVTEQQIASQKQAFSGKYGIALP